MFIWIVAVAAIIGVILNIFQKKSCFYIWSVTNATLAIHNGLIGEWAQMTLFIVYFVLAIAGLVAWTFNPIKPRDDD